MDKKDVQEFIGGFLGLLDSILKSSEIIQLVTECLKDTDELASEIEDIVEDLKTGGLAGVKSAFLNGAPDLIIDTFVALGNCSPLEVDIKILTKWAEKFSDPVGLAPIVAKNAIINGEDIVKDAIKLGGYVNKKNFINGGKMFYWITINLVGKP